MANLTWLGPYLNRADDGENPAAPATGLHRRGRPGHSGDGICAEVESPHTVNANDSCAPHPCLLTDVLMTVEKQTRLHSQDIAVERFKSNVDFIVPVVDMPWGVVRHEYVHRWEGCKLALDFVLFVKEMSSRLIPP